MQRIRIKYSKEGKLKFISHLDLMRVFERSVRRADIPVEHSQGFNPHMRISYGPPLPIGTTSISEYADIYLLSDMEPVKLKDQLNKALPPEIRVLDAKIVDLNSPSLASEINSAEYSIDFEGPADDLNEILKKEKLIIQRKEKLIDIKPMIHNLKKQANGRWQMVVQAGNNGSVKPEDIISFMPELKIKKITRTGLYKK